MNQRVLVEGIVAVLKKRFPNLKTEEAVAIAFDIAEVVEAAV